MNSPVWTDDRIEMVYSKIDLDESDSISHSEFEKAYKAHPTLRTAPGLGASLTEKLHADADAVFRVLDVDDDGTLQEVELRKHMTASGYQEATITKMFTCLDADGSGCVDREEFRRAFVNYPSMQTAPGLGGNYRASA